MDDNKDPNNAPATGNGADGAAASDPKSAAGKEQTGAPMAATQPPPAPFQTPPPPSKAPATPQEVRDAIRIAFALGWGLVDLKGRIEAERYASEQRGMRVASLWRVSLSMIAGMHVQAFFGVTTDNTFYAPEVEMPKYLFPAEGPTDYTQFGILSTQVTENLKTFKLYDVTQRAINCAALLYVNPDDGLDSARIKNLKSALTLAVTSDPDKTAEATVALTELVKKFLDAWDGFLREHYYSGGLLKNNPLESTAYEAGRSMASLSWKITSSTLCWERSLHQLRENRATLKQDDALRTECIAAIKTAADNDDVRQAWAQTFRQDFITRLQHDVVALSSALDDAYLADKAPGLTAAQSSPTPDKPPSTDLELPSISIRAIKQGLEYWRRAVVLTLDEVPAAKAGLAGDNKLSDYCSRYEWSPAMRLALNKQVNLWQTLIAGQQSLRAFSTESVAQKLVSEVWDEIQQGLSGDFTAAVQNTERAAVAIIEDAKKTVASVFNATKLYLGILLILAITVVVGGFVHMIGGGDATPSLTIAGIGAGVAAGLKWLGLSGFQKETNTKLEGNKNDIAKQTSTTAGGVGAGIESKLTDTAHDIMTDAFSALKRGFGQVQLELDDLNRSVSVTYPLIDYIALRDKAKLAVSVVPAVKAAHATPDTDPGVKPNLISEPNSDADATNSAARDRTKGTDGYVEPPVIATSGKPPGRVNFLMDIVWTSAERREEIKAVVRAAFGPIALLAYSAVQERHDNAR